TVYCAVFKNTEDLKERDVFHTRMPDFEGAFREGYGYKGNLSPRLDRKAKYLYLYQVVSDRGFDPRNRLQKPSEIKLAVDDAVNKIPHTQDIARFALRLIVHPKHITSWGYFVDRGFAAKVEDRNLNGIDQKKSEVTAVSFLPSILMTNDEASYQLKAVSHSLG